jgi:Family of unknown function (DUF6212)
MHIVFLVEEGLQDRLSLTTLLPDNSIYCAPLSDLMTIDGQLVSSKPERRLGTLINGFVLGVIAKSAPDGSVDATLRQRVAGIVPPAFRDNLFFAVDEGRRQSDDLLKWLLSRHSFAAGKFAQFSAQSDITLAEMRKLFLETQSALRSAEVALSHVSVPNLTLIEQIKSDDVFLPLPPAIDEASFSLSQKSLRHVKSLKRIDLHLKFATEVAGLLHVEACGVFSGKTFGTWHRPRSELEQGWNALVCPTESLINEPVEIKIAWRGDSARPAFALGLLVADHTAAAVVAGGDILDRPLALRLWKSGFITAAEIAGETAGSEESADTEAAGPDGPLNGAVVSVNLLSMAERYDGPAHVDASHIEWRGEKMALLVHPAGTQPMIAVIKDVDVNAMQRISARVRLDHAEASTTEFALFAVAKSPDENNATISSVLRNMLPGTAETKTRLRKTLERKARWLKLGANDYGEVSFQFDKPHSGLIDVFLLTRNAQEQSDFSWAFFESLSFEGESQRDAHA